MSAVCIRYKTDFPKDQLRKLHHQVATRIEKGGKFWFATTEMKGETWFRINPVNINTKIEHIERLYQLLKKVCSEVEEEMIQTSKTN
jgi:glutamate/tyrosine decarboxylase-like PLP-dependent enzyme